MAELKQYQLYIDGAWRDGAKSRRFPTINPFTRQAWASIPQAEAGDVADAVAAARRAFPDWSARPGIERQKLMLRLAELLEAEADRMSRLETTDNGKVIRETKPQMMFAARQYRFFAGYADKIYGSVIPLDQPDVFDFVMRVPIGVVALITAWNSPITLLANKLAPALAAGNCAVIKPSEHASATTLEFAALVEKAGFPKGVVNVVTGDAEVGRALSETPGLNRISFTGSAQVGRHIAAAAGRNLVPVTLELGGKSPNIIFDDADLNKAVAGALAGIFGASGQTCIAGSRLLVHETVHDEVVERLAKRAAAIKMGDPLDPATEMGTAANEQQFNRILDFIASAKQAGMQLVTGGDAARDGDLAQGFFVQPTIFSGVTPDAHLAQEEIFGPVLAILKFKDEAEAIQIANSTSYGLAAGVWTRDVGRVHRMVRAIESGVVWVNTYRAVAAQAPFGGMKESGFGRERGEQALQEYTTTKNVMIDYSSQDRDPFVMRT
ncbi:aldehyde dehydrogenase [Ferrovibrio terrae]|uniref:Aldehyde dehydrogenase n=1 Tax=Ferrovibrio terrae TaxID=2594003 RepID=A0A516H178_9PROT|nr:aldehyde dehydrogenase [Ferrovibrio terrae]QDO97541.1 aldehyde dehydrogenase [Ferrovibrio terrae]